MKWTFAKSPNGQERKFRQFLGNANCRIFRHGDAPRELGAGDDFGFLLRRD